jgi:hypothetical protein
VFSDSTFLESKQLPLDAPPETQWIEEYDYESDSDLGYVSADEDDRGLESSTVSSPVPGGESFNTFSSTLTGRQMTQLY